MLKNALKLVGLARKTMQESIDTGTSFIEDTLEKEYISGSIDKVKDLSGKVVLQAGMLYGKTVEDIKEVLESEKLQPLKSKLEDMAEELKEDGEKLATKAMSNDHIRKTVENINEVKDNVVTEINQFINKSEEEK